MSSAAAAVAFVLITSSSSASYHRTVTIQPMPDKETCELMVARAMEVVEKEDISRYQNTFYCRPLDGSDHLQFMDPYGYKKLQELQKKFNP